MNPKNKFWWFVAVSLIFTGIIIGSIFALILKQLSSQERLLLFHIFKQNSGYLFAVFILLVSSLFVALDGIFHNYIIPIHRITEETILIQSVNPSHRIRIEGSGEVRRLAEAINEAAEYMELTEKGIEEKIQTAKAQIEKEKNILATFMGELPEGVLICNTEGRIIFYNKQAISYLAETLENDQKGNPSADQLVGLGRSVFGLIDKNLIVHAMDDIAKKMAQQDSNLASYFVMIGKDGRILRVEAVPIIRQKKLFSGFILIFYDITSQIALNSRMDFLVQSLSRDTRGAIASIRSAIEAILEYPSLTSKQLDSFHNIIHRESLTLGSILDKTTLDWSCHIRSTWPLVQTSVANLIDIVRQKAEERLNVSIAIDEDESLLEINVDSYSFGLAILFLLSQLIHEAGATQFSIKYEISGKFINLDILWKGSPIKIETLRKWEDKMLKIEGEGIPLRLKEVLKHHEADIWCYASKQSPYNAYLRIFLPLPEASTQECFSSVIAIQPESRPEFYDFNLFEQPGQTPELDDRLLSELAYTVFDTETTGLNPAGGDEIISIGAVRIINCRLLYREFYDQLIDPKRSLPKQSIEIHKILPEMLEGQPTIDRVLPAFYKFAEDTILIAHNAAFDMRMLQMKEAQTGIKFINPVLDTLLLSAVIHPSQKDHNMEAIGKRLGIRIVGRHTALGDAIVTAEIFLKIIPLLQKAGIQTFKEARLASQKTYYSRLKY